MRADWTRQCVGWLTTSRHQAAVSAALLAGEALLLAAIIARVPYTKIDWDAYMQEVAGVVDRGERDYMRLEGETGPLVYPAGFVWVFALAYRVFDHGRNIVAAQALFAAIYLVNLAIVHSIYRAVPRLPNVYLVLLSLSRRVHSIYVLRLFNDPVAMLPLHAALLALVRGRYTLSVVLFSVALSIKMNVLLYAPAFGVVALCGLGLLRTFKAGLIAVALQVALAWPFLVENARSYFSRAFEFDRVFLYKWTVNWKIVEEAVFLSRPFHVALLVTHVGLLAWWLARSWRPALQATRAAPLPLPILRIVLVTNLIGVLCARSLHYQFYSWYFFSIPLLLYASRLPWLVQAAVFVAIEASWNVYPATWGSSLLLLCSHLLLLSSQTLPL